MNTANATEMGLTPKPAAGPIKLPKIKIKLRKTVTIMCPANMLANKRIIKTNGFVIIPVISKKGISGMGSLSHIGTSGLKISFQ